VNPGAAGRVGFHREVTLALLRVENGRCEAELVFLGPRVPVARFAPWPNETLEP